jgi:hypothetical protein
MTKIKAKNRKRAAAVAGAATCSPAREHVMSHIAQATAQMWQAEAALRDFGDDGKNCAALIQHLRYQLHKYKGLVPENASNSATGDRGASPAKADGKS